MTSEQRIIEKYGSIENYFKAYELSKVMDKVDLSKFRKDKGKERNKYDTTLPKNYLSYLKRANRKGICFDLSVEQFNTLIENSCIYCGTSPACGVDRVDNSDGYTEDNSKPCCIRCNLMKFTNNISDFIKHVKKIAKFNA